MYLDTSVFVKLYTQEPDSAECEGIVAGNKIVSSELLYAELWSALLAKERSGKMRPEMRQRVWEVFEMHVLDEVVELIELDGAIVREAAEVMARVHPHVPLRTLDAIHLATFAGIEAGTLFTNDRRMIDAARLLALPLARS
ncbi:MAG: type II toxin-antitoxin system VapC family toxin [Verrucomicrobia bacterium]|nr:type II toxin-antitoxin system VapC family toxin [Verrucomicrobiota bacterium]